MAKSIFEEIGYDRMAKLMGDAIQKDIAERHALGLPEVVKLEGTWSYQYPDGFVEPVGDGHPTPRLIELKNRIATMRNRG